jgi:hypothetical protein
MRAPRLATRDHCSSTRADARNKDIDPDADLRRAANNLTVLVLDCTKFQHALAFKMLRAVVAGVASC